MALAGILQCRSLLFWASVIFVLAVSISLREHIIFRAPPTRISMQDVIYDLDIPPLSFPATFRIDVDQNSARSNLEVSRLVVRRPAPNSPDTTAVILNWSRLPNVIRIVSLLCGPWLDDTIATVFIWNNSPQKLSQRDFLTTQCPQGKLKIYNSPSNLYFQGRFLACAEAVTPYCFIQDDDYLVLPEIIQAMSSRARGSVDERDIHLLPPHDSLSSYLRTIRRDPQLHTSFAWLGYGALIRRSRAVEFLALVKTLNFSEAEMNMADNYYTILSNSIPETWLDQGIELGGGQPFTVGTAGEIRNNKHIARAAEYLDSILSCVGSTCIARNLPFIDLTTTTFSKPVYRTPCLGTPCILETSIDLLPESVLASVASPKDMLTVENENLELLGEARKRHYLTFPLSKAVDGRTESAFISFDNAITGDAVSIDVLGTVQDDWRDIEMAWLVDLNTESILQASAFETSLDGVQWTSVEHALSCTDSSILGYEGLNSGENLRECAIRMLEGKPDESARFFRARLEKDLGVRWCIYEVWLRGLGGNRP